MKIGDKIIYGNEIECTFKKYEIIKNGEVIIYADCKGGAIIAPWEMFKKSIAETLQSGASAADRSPWL